MKLLYARVICDALGDTLGLKGDQLCAYSLYN